MLYKICVTDLGDALSKSGGKNFFLLVLKQLVYFVHDCLFS